jgi:Fe-S cluster assembly iron-binding protein IscA
MALDEPQENDLSFHHKGVTYYIDPDDFEKVKPIRIDFSGTDTGSGGYTITSRSGAPTYRPELKL